MLARYMLSSLCLFVCLSVCVCVSVTLRYCVKTAKHKQCCTIAQRLYAKGHGEILTESPPPLQEGKRRWGRLKSATFNIWNGTALMSSCSLCLSLSFFYSLHFPSSPSLSILTYFSFLILPVSYYPPFSLLSFFSLPLSSHFLLFVPFPFPKFRPTPFLLFPFLFSFSSFILFIFRLSPCFFPFLLLLSLYLISFRETGAWSPYAYNAGFAVA